MGQPSTGYDQLMDAFLFIALVLFLAGAVLAAVQKSWALALVAAGLFCFAVWSVPENIFK